MNRLQQTLMHAYRMASAPVRRRWLRLQVQQADAPVGVLFYHRIADTVPNGWTLSTQAFERQLDWLASRFDLVSLEEAQRRLREGNPSPAVAITFDDGYADNCDFAIPLLLQRGIPFTYFVSTHLVRDQTPFAHDLAAGEPIPVNTIEQIQAMAEAGVEIGAHTQTHADMGQSTDLKWIEQELLGSIEDLRAWTGRSIRYFAFPFGLPKNMTREAIVVARRAGLLGIVSAYGGYNLPSQVSEDHGPFHLRRIHADPEWARFVNWMTFDPRKVSAADPIDDACFLAPIGAGEGVLGG